MSYRSRLFIPTAFIAGVLLTLGFKELYPHLEHRFRQYRRLRRKRYQQTRNSTIVGAGLDESSGAYNGDDDDDDLIGLEDHTRSSDPEGRRRHGPDTIVLDGIEACVGNTPLFRIKSLSEETGCEIWAKAEVNPFSSGPPSVLFFFLSSSPSPRRDYDYRGLTVVVGGTVYERGRRESQGQSSFEYYQYGKFAQRNRL